MHTLSYFYTTLGRTFILCLVSVQASKDFGLDAMLHELCEDDAKV